MVPDKKHTVFIGTNGGIPHAHRSPACHAGRGAVATAVEATGRSHATVMQAVVGAGVGTHDWHARNQRQQRGTGRGVSPLHIPGEACNP